MERCGVKVSGFPMPAGIGCLETLVALCDYLEDHPSDEAAFEARFLPLLDLALNKFIEWAEREEPTPRRAWASSALVDRLMSLTAQADRLMAKNPSCEKRADVFGDRRRARLPESPISDLALDYVRRADSLAKKARALCIANPRGRQIRAGVLDEEEEWLQTITSLPPFNEDTWEKWAEVVYAKMLEEQDYVRVRRCLESAGTKSRLSSFRKAIFKAVKSNARRPAGDIRGITRPV